MSPIGRRPRCKTARTTAALCSQPNGRSKVRWRSLSFSSWADCRATTESSRGCHAMTRSRRSWRNSTFGGLPMTVPRVSRGTPPMQTRTTILCRFGSHSCPAVKLLMRQILWHASAVVSTFHVALDRIVKPFTKSVNMYGIDECAASTLFEVTADALDRLKQDTGVQAPHADLSTCAFLICILDPRQACCEHREMGIMGRDGWFLQSGTWIKQPFARQMAHCRCKIATQIAARSINDTSYFQPRRQLW